MKNCPKPKNLFPSLKKICLMQIYISLNFAWSRRKHADFFNSHFQKTPSQMVIHEDNSARLKHEFDKLITDTFSKNYQFLVKIGQISFCTRYLRFSLHLQNFSGLAKPLHCHSHPNLILLFLMQLLTLLQNYLISFSFRKVNWTISVPWKRLSQRVQKHPIYFFQEGKIMQYLSFKDNPKLHLNNICGSTECLSKDPVVEEAVG